MRCSQVSFCRPRRRRDRFTRHQEVGGTGTTVRAQMREASKAKVTVRLRQEELRHQPSDEPDGQEDGDRGDGRRRVALDTSLGFDYRGADRLAVRAMVPEDVLEHDGVVDDASDRDRQATRVMMFRLTPPSMSRRAAITLSGMLMAATIVRCTLSRNRRSRARPSERRGHPRGRGPRSTARRGRRSVDVGGVQAKLIIELGIAASTAFDVDRVGIRS